MKNELCIYYEPANADINQDGEVNLEDLSFFSSQWFQTELNSSDITPPGGNEVVDFADLGIFIEQWLEKLSS